MYYIRFTNYKNKYLFKYKTSLYVKKVNNIPIKNLNSMSIFNFVYILLLFNTLFFMCFILLNGIRSIVKLSNLNYCGNW